MTLQKDNFFSLTKGERQATISLLTIVLLLVGARVFQQYQHTRVQEQATEEYTNFQLDLKEFNNTLQEKEEHQPTKGKKKEENKKKGGKNKTSSKNTPKPLKSVPREAGTASPI